METCLQLLRGPHCTPPPHGAFRVCSVQDATSRIVDILDARQHFPASLVFALQHRYALLSVADIKQELLKPPTTLDIPSHLGVTVQAGPTSPRSPQPAATQAHAAATRAAAAVAGPWHWQTRDTCSGQRCTTKAAQSEESGPDPWSPTGRAGRDTPSAASALLAAAAAQELALRSALRQCRLALRTALFAAASIQPRKLKRLQELRVYVLDNSIRESTVSHGARHRGGLHTFGEVIT